MLILIYTELARRNSSQEAFSTYKCCSSKKPREQSHFQLSATPSSCIQHCIAESQQYPSKQQLPCSSCSWSSTSHAISTQVSPVLLSPGPSAFTLLASCEGSTLTLKGLAGISCNRKCSSKHSHVTLHHPNQTDKMKAETS